MDAPYLCDEIEGQARGAAFVGEGDCYRVALWRHTGVANPSRDWAVFVGLNPSTADATTDDPTIRRCVGFASRWSARIMVMLNLYAFRATDPKDLHAWLVRRTASELRLESDANYDAIRGVLDGTNSFCCGDAPVILAWGAHGAKLGGRCHLVEQLVWGYTQAQCLGTTKGGEPRHPLYLPYGTPYATFERKGVR